MDASIFDSALSHTRRSDASEKREENSVSTFGRFRLWTSFESSPVSVNQCERFYFHEFLTLDRTSDLMGFSGFRLVPNFLPTSGSERDHLYRIIARTLHDRYTHSLFRNHTSFLGLSYNG